MWLIAVKSLSGCGQMYVMVNIRGGAVYNNNNLYTNNCALSRGTIYILPKNSLQSTDPGPYLP